jgi:hypothetical protein
VDRV